MNKWMESDWVLRISSVVLAIIFWLIVTQSFPFKQNDQTTIQIDDVKVETRYDKHQFALTQIRDERVKLSLSGNKKDLSSIPAYQVYVDLTNIKAGERRNVPIQVNGLPKDVKVSISPANTVVRLEEKIHREVPIQIEYKGKLPEGYVVEQVMMNPERALVKGTEAQLEKVKYVRAMINLSNEQFPLKKWVALQAISSEGVMKDVRISPETTNISIRVRKPNKQVPLSYQIIKQPPEGVVIDQIVMEPSKVTISGLEKDLQGITAYPPLQLDLSKVTDNQTITMIIPTINQAIEVEPQKTTIKVYIKRE